MSLLQMWREVIPVKFQRYMVFVTDPKTIMGERCCYRLGLVLLSSDVV